ncbi:Leucine-rich repeat-containing protein 37A2 [Heterocephalus glaber]|uniref:Leucine-rich repeat-containing protein 37A2 n=1 Tax=Heterocephalus glaber TaxID=10181 RepID=G5BCX6_HETGA|nr:Leucine-rich repeat-containing protein 37A2 [Heterocephalus glaber]
MCAEYQEALPAREDGCGPTTGSDVAGWSLLSQVREHGEAAAAQRPLASHGSPQDACAHPAAATNTAVKSMRNSRQKGQASDLLSCVGIYKNHPHTHTSWLCRYLVPHYKDTGDTRPPYWPDWAPNPVQLNSEALGPNKASSLHSDLPSKSLHALTPPANHRGFDYLDSLVPTKMLSPPCEFAGQLSPELDKVALVPALAQQKAPAQLPGSPEETESSPQEQKQPVQHSEAPEEVEPSGSQLEAPPQIENPLEEFKPSVQEDAQASEALLESTELPKELQLCPTQLGDPSQCPYEPPNESVAHPPAHYERTVPPPAQEQALLPRLPSVASHPLDLEVTIVPKPSADGELPGEVCSCPSKALLGDASTTKPDSGDSWTSEPGAQQKSTMGFRSQSFFDCAGAFLSASRPS